MKMIAGAYYTRVVVELVGQSVEMTTSIMGKVVVVALRLEVENQFLQNVVDWNITVVGLTIYSMERLLRDAFKIKKNIGLDCPYLNSLLFFFI